MSQSSIGQVAAAASVLCVIATPAAAQEKGELWATTSQAVVEGSPMEMPLISGEHCAKKDWAEAPVSGDPSQHCQNSNFKRNGDTVTWSVVCENPPMSGEGELHFDGEDSYAGVLQFKSGSTNMRVQMTGKRIGSCDNPR